MQYLQISKYGEANSLYSFNPNVKAIVQVKHRFNGDKNNKFFSFPLVCDKERDDFIRESLNAGLHMLPSYLTESEIKHFESLGLLIVKDGQRKLLKLNCERLEGGCELVTNCEDLVNAVKSYIDSYKEDLIKKHQAYLTCLKRLVSVTETIDGIKYYKHLNDYVVGFECGEDFFVYFATSIDVVRSLPYTNIYCGIDFGIGVKTIYAIICDDLRKYCDMCDLYTIIKKPNAFNSKKFYREMNPFSVVNIAQLIGDDCFKYHLSVGDGDFSSWLELFANISDLEKFYQVIVKDNTLVVFNIYTLEVCFCLSNKKHFRLNLGLKMCVMKPVKQLTDKRKCFFLLNKDTLNLSGQHNKGNRKALNKFERLLSAGDFLYDTFYISTLSKVEYEKLLIEFKLVFKEWARCFWQRTQASVRYQYHFLSFTDTLEYDIVCLINPFIQKVSVNGVLQGFCVFSKISKHYWYEMSSTFIRDAYPSNLAKVLDFKMLQYFKDDPDFLLDIGSATAGGNLAYLKQSSNPSLLGVKAYVKI